jgi:hypothetical protein
MSSRIMTQAAYLQVSIFQMAVLSMNAYSLHILGGRCGFWVARAAQVVQSH